MSVVVVICASCSSYGVFAKFFFQKEFFGELLNSFPAPQFGFYHLFESSLKRLDKPSLRFKEKHNCKVKKYSHVDTNAYWSELALQ